MILITGGAGFIGSNLAAALAERGHSLAVCDRVDGAKAGNLAKLELAALVTPEQLADFLEDDGGRLTAVVHLGAISSTTETDEDKLRRTNVEMSQALWRFCVRTRLPFLYASSAATYGDGAQGFDDNPDLAYLRALQPLNPFGRSKNAFDI
ncbi:MAG: NAD-dependent epimerase/dehydratase family protein, partial [Rhodovibrionaceae bacterium]